MLACLDNYLKNGSTQKDKCDNGEVFTPMNIVFEMLNKLDDSIFKEINYKWFDPAVGIGNFMVGVYLKLMDGLSVQIPNIDDRKRHILENMLFMSEINSNNVHKCKQVFKEECDVNINIYEGNTLTLNLTNSIGQFDVIVGNPPFNSGGIRSYTGSQSNGKNETIWTKFVIKSFEYLKPNGFLLFITPLTWLKKSHPLHTIMILKRIIWIKVWDNLQSMSLINANIPISFYLLQMCEPNNTNVIFESVIKRKKLNMMTYVTFDSNSNSNNSIPLAHHSIFNKLLAFINLNNLHLEYKYKTVKSIKQQLKIQLPLTYELEDNWAIETHTLKYGLMVKKSIQRHPDADKRKLIIANKSGFIGAFIDEGKLGLSGYDKIYIMGDNLELLLKLLSFKICDIICQYTKYRQDFLEREAYVYIPDIRKLGIKDINEHELYQMIGLTEEEITLIAK